MKKILLLTACLGIFCLPVLAETIQYADRVVEVEDEHLDVRDAQGNHFEVGKTEEGNPRIATGHKNSPVGEISFEARDENTVRFGMAGQSADFKHDPDNPNKIIMTNPNGNEKVSIEQVTNEVTGETEVIMRDLNTGKVISHTKGREKESVDSVSNINGNEREIHLKKTGSGEKDVSGSMKMKDSKNSADITIVNGEVQKGQLSMTEGGYKKDIKLGLGGLEIYVRDAKTNALKYRGVTKKGYSYLYDANDKLIAEGKDDSEEFEKIYDKAAYAEFEKIMDADDDDEPEIPVSSIDSISDLKGFFGF